MAFKYFSSAFSFVAFLLMTLVLAQNNSQVDSGSDGNPAISFNILTADLKLLQRKLEDGSLRSVGLVEACLSQIKAHDSYLHAILSLAPRDSLIGRAKALDQERKGGKLRSPLHGIPIIIKDNIATHPSLGMVTSAGSFALRESRPKRNAKIVDKLLAAGLIILGKSNLSELANYKGYDLPSGWSAVGGQTQSAYVRGGLELHDSENGYSSPSGSSSGSAVGVSAGYAPLSIGTDTVGSLINPASRAAVYTLRPTLGLIDTTGIVPVSHTFDALGPMAKTPFDIALVLDALVPTQPDGQQSYTSALTASWNNISVATLDPAEWSFGPDLIHPVEDATAQINQEIRSAYAKIQANAKLYADNSSFLLYGDFRFQGGDSIGTVLSVDFAKDINAYLADLESSPVRNLGELINFNLVHADIELPPGHNNQDKLQESYRRNISAEDYQANVNHMRGVARDRGIDALLNNSRADVLIGPADSYLASYAAAAGYPIATLPLGYLKLNGGAFGLCAIAKAHQEALLLSVQSAWEATFGPRLPPNLNPSSKQNVNKTRWS